jgi:hypothetical protein
MLNGLKFVVDVELRSHLNEAEEVNESNKALQNKRVPTLMLFVDQGVNLKLLSKEEVYEIAC